MSPNLVERLAGRSPILAADFRGVPEVHVYCFHALCRWQIGAGGLEFPDQPAPDWWDTKAPDLLIQAVNETGFEVDAAVVSRLSMRVRLSSWLVRQPPHGDE